MIAFVAIYLMVGALIVVNVLHTDRRRGGVLHSELDDLGWAGPIVLAVLSAVWPLIVAVTLTRMIR